MLRVLPRAYCDESETGKCLAIAGYLGSDEQWAEFDAAWNAALVDKNLSEWHTSRCEAGEEEYEGREDRRDLQDLFAILLRESDLYGLGVAIDLAAYSDLLPRFEALKNSPREASPYFLVWQMVTQLMAHFIERGNLPHDEVINFAFDRKAKHQGQAIDTFNEIKGQRWSGAVRLGAITHEDSHCYPGLQAADYLAFEQRKEAERRWFSGEPGPRRQLTTLIANGRVTGVFADRKWVEQWAETVARKAGEDWVQQAVEMLRQKSQPHAGVVEFKWDEPWARIRMPIPP